MGCLCCSRRLTSALSAASGSHCAPGSPLPPLPRGTDGPAPSSPWPRSAGWTPPLQTGCWSRKDGLKRVRRSRSLLHPRRPLGDYLQDPGLLFKIFVFVRLGIGKVVNFDSVLIDLIQDLTRRAGKQQPPLGTSTAGVPLTGSFCLLKRWLVHWVCWYHGISSRRKPKPGPSTPDSCRLFWEQ